MDILLRLLSIPEFYVGLALGFCLGALLLICGLMLLGWLDELTEAREHAADGAEVTTIQIADDPPGRIGQSQRRTKELLLLHSKGGAL